MAINTILVVDDDRDIRRIAALALGALGGFDVSLAASGEEAVEAAQVSAPDLVLLDGRMPGMDGRATLQALRANPVTAAVPVIFVTATADPAELAGYVRLGARGVIPKPFDPMTLATQVRRIMDAPA